MDRSSEYANILTEILYAESKARFHLKPELKLVAACDHQTGQFFMVMIGWDQDDWVHNIVFHAQLIGGKVLIEVDNTEGLMPALLEAGIRAEDFLDDRDFDYSEAARAAA
ncbi:MAG: XisI protein [Acidobacteria bacterium]|nr:XisI protein [Acidobacteriota bacterium]MBI3421524.1 XisI protein [Acidobacteriota bacterium]